MAALLLRPAFADCAEGDTSAAQQVSFYSLVEEMMATMDDICTILDTVKDRPSADAAAVPLSALLAKLAEMHARGSMLEEPAIAGKAEPAVPEAAFEAAEQRMCGRFMALAEADCYGSEALRKLVALF